MANQRDPLPRFEDDDDAKLRQFGAQRGLLPQSHQPTQAVQPAPAPVHRHQPSPEPVIIYRDREPALQRAFQTNFPEYLIDELQAKSGASGKPVKVLIMEALRQSGYHVEDIDMRDQRKKRGR
jgi:hypothetical protein